MISPEAIIHHILLIDDHAIFRSGLRLLLKETYPQIEISEAESVEQALALDIEPPGLVLLDIKLPGVSGLEGIALLKQRWPALTVVVLSALDTPESLDFGAAGFVSKREAAGQLLERITQALQGTLPIAVEANGGNGKLTVRQREVLNLVGHGRSNKLIARQLSLAENTVRRHVQDILEQLGASSRSEAMAIARRRGLIE